MGTNETKKDLKIVEMESWRRNCGTSRLDHITNEEIRRRMEVESYTLDTIKNWRDTGT